MAPWIVPDSWKAGLDVCLETCWSLWADMGLHKQVWAAKASTAAFLSEPAKTGKEGVLGVCGLEERTDLLLHSGDIMGW